MFSNRNRAIIDFFLYFNLNFYLSLGLTSFSIDSTGTDPPSSKIFETLKTLISYHKSLIMVTSIFPTLRTLISTLPAGFVFIAMVFNVDNLGENWFISNYTFELEVKNFGYIYCITISGSNTILTESCSFFHIDNGLAFPIL